MAQTTTHLPATVAEVAGHAVPTGAYVGGTWLPADVDGRGGFDVENPATGETIARVTAVTDADTRAAMDAAAAAAPGWAATPARERAEILRRAFDLVAERTEAFAAVMTAEMGKPLAEARGEVTYGNEFLRWFSEQAAHLHDRGTFGPNPEGTATIAAVKQPVGIAYLVLPWNFPLAMGTRKIGPALAAGCTVVVKPAHQTPLTTLLLAQALADAGVPAGVVNVLTTDHSAAVSDVVFADDRLRKISFTGSTPVGVHLLKQAADKVLRTSMELGGNAPFLVFDDADVDQAVDGAMVAKFRNGGEACNAANRFYVQRGVAEEFTAKLAGRIRALALGDGAVDGTQVGPVIDEKARDRIAGLVDDAVARGATLLAGGHAVESAGHFFEPTLLAGVPDDAEIRTQEIFGPVAAVSVFDTEDEAVALANDTEFGLMAYAFTRDIGRGLRVASRLEAGMVGLNQGAVSNAAAPFGGVKASGVGREGGGVGIEEFLETKYIGIGR